MTPEATAIIANANALDSEYAAAQAQIASLQAQLNAVAVPSPVFTPVRYASLQQRTDWSRGADSAGLAGTATYTHNSDGSTTFAFAPSSAYNNDYNFVNLESGTRDALRSKYLQITDFEISESAVSVAQQVETNFEHTLDNNQYNGGISVLFGADTMRDPVSGAVTSTVKSHIWRWYDITPGRAGWYELPEIPYDTTMFGVGKRVRIVSEFIRIDSQMTHSAVTINGTRYPINRTSTCKPQPTWGPHMQHGFQLDTRAAVVGYSVKLWDAECQAL